MSTSDNSASKALESFKSFWPYLSPDRVLSEVQSDHLGGLLSAATSLTSTLPAPPPRTGRRSFQTFRPSRSVNPRLYDEKMTIEEIYRQGKKIATATSVDDNASTLLSAAQIFADSMKAYMSDRDLQFLKASCDKFSSAWKEATTQKAESRKPVLEWIEKLPTLLATVDEALAQVKNIEDDLRSSSSTRKAAGESGDYVLLLDLKTLKQPGYLACSKLADQSSELGRLTTRDVAQLSELLSRSKRELETAQENVKAYMEANKGGILDWSAGVEGGVEYVSE